VHPTLSSMPRKKRDRKESLSAVESLSLRLTNARQRKALHKELKVKDLLNALKTALEGESTVEEVVNEILDTLPSMETFSFSAIEVKDVVKFGVEALGELDLKSDIEKAVPSEHFTYFCKRIAQRLNLKSEIARRNIIDIFLLEAIGDLQSENDDIACYPEHEIKTVDAGTIKLHGFIDYVFAFSNIKNVRARMRTLKVGQDVPGGTFLTALEAKKDESMFDGIGQTLAEMKALWAQNEVPREIYGTLSDGTRWVFFILDKEGKKYSQTSTFNHPEQTIEILTILKELVRGKNTLLDLIK